MHSKTALGDVDDYMTCPACDKIFISFKPYRGPQASDEDGMDSESVDNEPATGFGNSKGKKRKDEYVGSSGRGFDALGFEPKVADSTWVARSDRDDFPLAPSAKTAALKAILLKGFAAAPLDKVSPPSQSLTPLSKIQNTHNRPLTPYHYPFHSCISVPFPIAQNL